MMENENNDGVCPPKPVDQSLRETATALAVEYPRAAAYLRAQGYLQSENINKYSAGKHAMELLVDGGNIEDAENILKNWLPKDID